MSRTPINFPPEASLPMIVVEVPCVALGWTGVVMFPAVWWSWTMAILFTLLLGISVYGRWYLTR
ncbi:hypothetical protein [Micromonospora aurantiaca (nom. illeg.)]|uniref:hypothetical protein n=1 Tax=Micromonospora aurantiaca (nom. illeg.) TaxID=47850 RepID=UPI00365464B1